MGEYVHWREYMDMPYLRAEMLAPKERRVLTIKEVKREVMPSMPGQPRRVDENGNPVDEHQPVAYFVEDVLPMVLNVTNCQTIEELYGIGEPSKWGGLKIQIFATKTKVAGKLVPCLRVDKVKPTSNAITYSCCVCGEPITKETYDRSVARFGKPYCSQKCYELDTNGAKIDL